MPLGKDIHGWVEVRHTYEGAGPGTVSEWLGVIKMTELVGRSYDMFASLFGGQPSYIDFVPVAPQRGMPADISEEAVQYYLEWQGLCDETWITWNEVAVINWDDEALDRRPHEYVQDSAGKWTLDRTKSHADKGIEIVDGNSWQAGDRLYKIVRVSRRDSLDTGWQMVFRLMGVLAEKYGGDNVRLVVWFES